MGFLLFNYEAFIRFQRMDMIIYHNGCFVKENLQIAIVNSCIFSMFYLFAAFDLTLCRINFAISHNFLHF